MGNQTLEKCQEKIDRHIAMYISNYILYLPQVIQGNAGGLMFYTVKGANADSTKNIVLLKNLQF